MLKIQLALLVVSVALVACAEKSVPKTPAPKIQTKAKTPVNSRGAGVGSCAEEVKKIKYQYGGHELCKTELSENDQSKYCTFQPQDSSYLTLIFQEANTELSPGEAYLFSAADPCVDSKIIFAFSENPKEQVDYDIQAGQSFQEILKRFYLNERLGTRTPLCMITNNSKENVILGTGDVLTSKLFSQREYLTNNTGAASKVLNTSLVMFLNKGKSDLRLHCFTDVAAADTISENTLTQMLGVFSVQKIIQK